MGAKPTHGRFTQGGERLRVFSKHDGQQLTKGSVAGHS